MTDTTDTLSEAEREAAEADAEVARIEQALLDGDESVSPSDLVDAEDRRGKLRKALDAAKRITTERAERKAEAERLARIEELDALISERFGSHEGDIVAAFDVALDAITELCTKVADHNHGLHEILAELRAVAPLPKRLEPREGRLRLENPAVEISTVDAGRLIAEAVERAVHRLDRAVDSRGISEILSASKTASAGAAEAEQYGVAIGDRIGPSDSLRRTARIVAERDTPTTDTDEEA